MAVPTHSSENRERLFWTLLWGYKKPILIIWIA